MKSVNLKALAEQLNLSVSTVSKALNDSYEITPETKKRVLDLAQALHYQPNPYASSLRGQKSKTIAVIIPEIANNFFTLAINGIETVARENGYHVLIYLTHEDYHREVAFTQLLLNGRADGILLSASANTAGYDHLLELKQKMIPLVLFDRVFEELDTPRVTTDDLESGYNATKHLLEQGCKQVAHLMIAKHASIGSKRREGYQKALADHGFRPEAEQILHCGEDQEENYRQLKALLTSASPPDGIFASVEKLALLCYRAAAELGIAMPQQLKLISFSNLETAPYLQPSLTTITQPAFNIGMEAASILFRGIRTKEFPATSIVLPSKLVMRHSSTPGAPL